MYQKLIYLFTLCLALAGAKAQNYQTVNSGHEAYFSFSGTDFNFLRIDSAGFNGDSVLYPQLTLDYNEELRGWLPKRASWAGSEIIIRSNGTNVYFNHNLDSIVLKTQANLNEKWTVYQLSDSISIEAEVTKVQEETFLGLTDTVKTIQFRVFDATGNQLEHPLNNMPIELSKNYGWKTAINFNLFPNPDDSGQSFPDQYFSTCKLIGLKNPKVGIQNLTWFDVYDFQPGDITHVFNHYYNCCGGGPCEHFYRRTIDTYLESTNFSDSIVYTIDREQQNLTYKYTDTIAREIRHETIRQVIRANPKFDILSGELAFSEDSNRIYMVEQYLGEQILKFSLIPFVFSERNNCWNEMMVDGGGYSYYLKGLGDSDYDYNEICSGSKQQLQYYKKGDKEWGIPFTFTGIQKLSNVDRFKVYPNPASKVVYVETDNEWELVTFNLFTSNGKLVLSESLIGERPSVDVSNLPMGLYYYQIFTQSQLKATGNMVIRQ